MPNLILHGAYAMASDIATPAEFDRLTGVPQSMVHVSFPMQNGGMLPFPASLLAQYWAKGQLALVTWGTWDYATGHAFPWLDIVGGRYDSYLHTYATAVAAYAHPVLFRLDHEINLGPMPNLPYIALANADPVGYLSAWRHIVELFRSDGATNATWAWNINAVTPPGMGKSTDADRVAALYPGDSLVDWTSFDAYNWGASNHSPWLSWRQIVSGYSNWIGDTYGALVAVAPTKPILVGEYGCHTLGGPMGVTPNGDKTRWIADMLATTPTLYPQIAAISYFHRSYPPAPIWHLDGYDGMAWLAGVTGHGYVPTGFSMPPDNVPLQPYRLVAVSGDPVSGASAQAALLLALRAETTAARAATAAAQAALDTGRQTIRDAEAAIQRIEDWGNATTTAP